MVLYKALYKNSISKQWVRPLAMFEELVNIEGKKVKRFKFIE